MSSAPASAARAPGRPRSADVEARILASTQDLLAEHGYAGTTIAAVAREAGSGKAAIYRRWSSKIELVIAAVRALHEPPAVPDAGSLREDVLACAMHYANVDDRSGRVLASLLGEIGHDAELYAAARSAIGGPPVDAMIAVLERWLARGAVRPTAPIAVVASIVPTFAFGSVTLQRRSLSPERVTELIDEVVLPAIRVA